MKNELVSVIITTYNNPVGLMRAFQSVIHQTYDNIEIIIVDGGVTTMYARPQYATFRTLGVGVDVQYITNIISSNNKIGGNVQECRNVGVKHAHGKYIAMLDDDDAWDETKIEKQMKLIVTRSMKYRGGIIMIDKPMNNPTYDDLLQSFCYSQTSTYLMRKRDLIECGGFNESLRSMHEYDVALRMALRGMRIDCVNETLTFSNKDKLNKKHYFTKIAELLDLYRTHGKQMMHVLTKYDWMVSKTIALLFMYSLGYVFGGAVWKILFTLKLRLNQ